MLQLHPGEHQHLLRCSLTTASLQEQHREAAICYEAISYSWGDPADVATILCHDRELLVPANLVQALLQFRDESVDRCFWADAVCIDQVWPRFTSDIRHGII